MKGLNINKNSKGTFLNISIPGTGLYNRVRLETPSKKKRKK
jgi:hypothetical protein